MGYSATAIPQQSSEDSQLTAAAPAIFTITGCSTLLPTISLTNLQQWAAVTYSWQVTQSASPATVQLQPGQAGTANYQAQLVKTRQSGSYWVSGTIRLENPAKVPVTVTGIKITGTGGHVGTVPVQCLGAGNLQGALAPSDASNAPLAASGGGSGPSIAPGTQVCAYSVNLQVWILLIQDLCLGRAISFLIFLTASSVLPQPGLLALSLSIMRHFAGSCGVLLWSNGVWHGMGWDGVKHQSYCAQCIGYAY